jgi:hypothetical protein
MFQNTSIKALDSNKSFVVALDIVFVASLVIGSLIGIHANYICYRIYNRKEFNSIIFKYIAANSLVDILFLCSGMTFTIINDRIGKIQKEMDSFLLVIPICLIRLFTQLSSFTSLYITIHRCLTLKKHKLASIRNYKW